MKLNRYGRIAIGLVAGWLVLAGLLVLLHATAQMVTADPATLFVKPDGSGTTCVQDQPCSLPTGLEKVTTGDTVYVAAGRYTGTGTAVVTITQSITLYGSWDGAPAGPVVRDPDTYPTTLDGELKRRGVFISGNITPTLDSFVVTQGNASNASANPGRGGGIYCFDANPIIINNVITGNIAYTSTSSRGYGGGIYIEGTSSFPARATIHNNQILNNKASTTRTGQGGGLEIRLGEGVIVSDNTIQDNIAGNTINGVGGGLDLYNTSAMVSGNLIQRNRSTTAGAGFGGALYSQFGAVTLDGNTITANTAQNGAVTFQQNASFTVTNNIVAQNNSGISFMGSELYRLGGIVANNTIAQNGDRGLNVGLYNTGYCTLHMTNNIIVSHTIGILVNEHQSNSNAVTVTHTLFYQTITDTLGSSITSTQSITGNDPLFVNPGEGDFHLQANSPAVDAGMTIPWLSTDIDGDLRPWPAGEAYDIGADEARFSQIFLPLVTSSP